MVKSEVILEVTAGRVVVVVVVKKTVSPCSVVVVVIGMPATVWVDTLTLVVV